MRVRGTRVLAIHGLYLGDAEDAERKIINAAPRYGLDPLETAAARVG